MKSPEDMAREILTRMDKRTSQVADLLTAWRDEAVEEAIRRLLRQSM